MADDVVNMQDLVDPATEQQSQVETSPVEQTTEPAQEVAPAKEPIVTQPKPEGMAQQSFRMLRDEKIKIEKERDEMRRRLSEYEAKFQPTVTQEEPQLKSDLRDDDLIEGRHYNGLAKEIDTLRKQVRDYNQQSAKTYAFYRLKSEYSDYDQVVSQDNLAMLETLKPAIARTILANPDPYDQGETAYTMIKGLGLDKEKVDYAQQNEQANRNLAKPRPAVGSTNQADSPLNMANAFASASTPETKKKIYQQAREYANKKGFI